MPCISLFIFVFFQDVVCCHYSETPFPPLHCDLCHQNICNDCEAKHVSELSKPHEIVPFKERGSTPICTKLYCKIIDLYCTDCEISLYVQCASSKEHQQHKTVKGKIGLLKLALQELEKYIYPKYQEIETHIRYVKDYINKNSPKLTQTLEARRKVWYGKLTSL